jgi:hypothetical protein
LLGPIEVELFEEFRERGVLRDNMLLLDQESAIDYVRRAFGFGAPILGIDSFEMTGDSLRTEDYIDYSASSFRPSAPDIWKEAEDFLRRRSKIGLLFEVVIDERSAARQGTTHEQ